MFIHNSLTGLTPVTSELNKKHGNADFIFIRTYLQAATFTYIHRLLTIKRVFRHR